MFDNKFHTNFHMNTYNQLLCWLCLCILASCSSSRPNAATLSANTFSESEALAFMATYEQALATEDFQQVAPLTHERAVFRYTEEDFAGHAAIKQAMEKTWALEIEKVKYYLSDIQVVFSDTHSATLIFHWNWEGSTAQGEFKILGRGTAQLVKVEDKIQMILQHLSNQ